MICKTSYIFLKKYIYYFSLFIKSFLKYFFKPKDKPTLDFLEVWVGTKCSLKCKYCMHLIPYFNKKEFYKMDDIINDLDNLLENAEIKTLSIAGGEPFLHPELYRLINYISKREDIKLCHIMTNATKEPDDKIKETLLNLDKKFLIRIGQYKGKENIQGEFINYVKENKINHELLWSYDRENRWWIIALPGHKKTGIQKTDKVYRNCKLNWCLTLADGLLSTCTRGISMHDVFKHRGSVFEDIYIRKVKMKSILKALICTCNQKKYYKECCGFCLGVNPATEGRIAEGKEQL